MTMIKKETHPEVFKKNTEALKKARAEHAAKKGKKPSIKDVLKK